jgi:hypothetical protein
MSTLVLGAAAGVGHWALVLIAIYQSVIFQTPKAIWSDNAVG